MKKPIVLSAFLLMVVAQWFIPMRMIMSKEHVLTIGKEFRFRTEPYDPYDAFRGKYIHLAFQQTSVQLHDTVTAYNQGDVIYGLISLDSLGFAHIRTVTKVRPADNVDYMKLEAGYVYVDSVTSISFNFPFDRFYMEESKASAADEAYREALRDTSKVTYALLKILKGEAVIEDVIIDGKPIKEVAARRQKENPE